MITETIKNLSLLLIIGVLLSANLQVKAYEQEMSVAKEGDKAVHGVINVLTFPLEFPMQSYKKYKSGSQGLSENPNLASLIGGVWGFVVPGTYKATGRLWLGVYQLGGFWMLNSATNEGHGLPLEGEYAFDFDEPPEVSFGTGSKLIGNKLRRGLLNVYWGLIAELPGNIASGFSQKAPVRGFIRGTWYMVSRLWDGIHETGGFLLPSYEHTFGYAFDVDDPWHKKPDAEDEFQFSSAQ